MLSPHSHEFDLAPRKYIILVTHAPCNDGRICKRMLMETALDGDCGVCTINAHPANMEAAERNVLRHIEEADAANIARVVFTDLAPTVGGFVAIAAHTERLGIPLDVIDHHISNRQKFDGYPPSVRGTRILCGTKGAACALVAETYDIAMLPYYTLVSEWDTHRFGTYTKREGLALNWALQNKIFAPTNEESDAILAAKSE